MRLTTVYSSNEPAVSNSITNSVDVTKYNDFYTLVGNSQYRKKSVTNQVFLNLTKKKNSYLSMNTIQKMVQRFLTEKKMSKEKLARTLAITVRDLERIFSQDDLSRLISKVNLPLIRLYCKTKWRQ
ncbi:hypothetical protein GAMM_60193 [Gammaproteobacteria bacterium]